MSDDEFLQRVLSNLCDVVVVLDTERAIRFVSPSVTSVAGYRVDELLGREACSLVHPEDAPSLQQAFQEWAHDFGDPHVHQFRYRHGNGTWRACETTSRSMHHDPGVRGTVLALRDITDRPDLDAARRLQAQKMEVLGTLSASVVHDFSNLVGTILGYSEMALLRLPPGDALRTDLEQIQQAAQLAASLTQGLRAFMQQRAPETRRVNLNTVVSDLDRIVRPLLGTHVTLALRHTEPLDAVLADAAQMEVMLLNLVVNARDAMQGPGLVTIETGHASGEESGIGPSVRITVEDTGRGMDALTQERIFEPFFTTKTHGTGLGLSTVAGIVRKHGGVIKVESQPGLGSTFRIYLPRQCTPSQPIPAFEEPLKGD